MLLARLFQVEKVIDQMGLILALGSIEVLMKAGAYIDEMLAFSSCWHLLRFL